MSEMVIPGTYITVRSEGLISAGRISTGVLGIVGTASKGPLGKPVTLASFADARDTFGVADDLNNPITPQLPLTLVRAIQLAYDNGASTVIAVRAASNKAQTANLAMPGDAQSVVATLSAKTPGSYGNNIRVQVAVADDRAHIVNETTDIVDDPTIKLNYAPVFQTPGNRISVLRAASHKLDTFAILYNVKDVKAGQVSVNTADGTLTFSKDETPIKGDKLISTYDVDKTGCSRVTITLGSSAERYTVTDGRNLVQQLKRSTLVVPSGGTAGKPQINLDAYLGSGTNTAGNDGADAIPDDYVNALDTLSDQLVNIVVLAGQDANTMCDKLLSHLNTTENSDHERIGVIGATGSTVDDYLGHNVSSGRIVLVAPGIQYPNGDTLPSGYTAAAVAGLISSLDIQTSLTNKVVNVSGLTIKANRGQQAQLIDRSLLTLISKDGYRVLKSITAAGQGDPFINITTRRIVDHAKYGVRSAANPYLGRLNNSRVRGALKSTLDAFLTGMVADEALTGYTLSVDATRAQEIAGEVSVVMTLQPTFSIDYIRVVMNLQ